MFDKVLCYLYSVERGTFEQLVAGDKHFDTFEVVAGNILTDTTGQHIVLFGSIDRHRITFGFGIVDHGDTGSGFQNGAGEECVSLAVIVEAVERSALEIVFVIYEVISNVILYKTVNTAILLTPRKCYLTFHEFFHHNGERSVIGFVFVNDGAISAANAFVLDVINRLPIV